MHRNPVASTTPFAVAGTGDATVTRRPDDSPSRLDRLHSDDDGAQAVEYAMIGGLGAGVIGLLWSVISRTSLLDTLVTTLVTSLVELIRSWF